MAGRQSERHLLGDQPRIWFTNEEGYVNSFEEVKQVIDDFEVNTRSCFVMYSSNASFGKTGKYYTCHKSTPRRYLLFIFKLMISNTTIIN